MKKMIIAILAATAIGALAADNAPTNYFSGYRFVGAATNAGDTGLATNTPYIAVPVASLTGLTTNQAAGGGDVRAVVYGFAQAFYTAREASTNQTPTAITRATSYAVNGTNIEETVTHVLRSVRTIGSATFP
jgi:hypothetical protein